MNDWFTTPADDGNGNTVIVTGRLDVEKFRSKERNSIRVEVTMPYTPGGHLGFPDEATSELLDRATEAMQLELKGKTTAIMTGIYTGSGERNWIFYTFSTDVLVLSSTEHWHHCPHSLLRYTPKTTPNGPNTTK